VLPLQRGTAQLHAERDLAGGQVSRRVRGIPGDPSELGSLGSPFPRGAAHSHHDKGEGASCSVRRRRVDLAAGDTQGTLHPLHDDLQQR
jgi:hypothetical protein